MSQQLVKKGANGKYSNVNPKSWTEAIKDKNTGQSLVEILQGINMYYLSYTGDIESTRLQVPRILRKRGLWIVYEDYNHVIHIEWYNNNSIDDEDWIKNNNWSDVNFSGGEGGSGDGSLLKIKLEDSILYVSYNDGISWEEVGKVQNIDANEEDLIIEGNIIKLNNRDLSKGKGYVILRTEKPLSEQMVQENTIYEVRYDFDLGGETFEMPHNCELRFNGSILRNGTLKGINTAINTGCNQIFGEGLSLSGSFAVTEWIPEWFGAKGEDAEYMSTDGIQKALNAARDTTVKTVKLVANNYYIDDTLVMYAKCALKGSCDATKHYMGNRIYQTANKHGLQLTSDSDENIWQIALENIAIYSLYKGDDITSCGIYVYKDTIASAFMRNTIKNVWVGYFHTGFKFDGYGYYGFGYNKFDTFQAAYNRIGIHIKGSLSTDTTKTQRTSWANHNKFDFCTINSNVIGGIYFEDLQSEQENVFTHCAIEGNGNGYKYEYYSNITGCGFAFYGKNKQRLGYTRFVNCYIEGNYPRRSNDGSATADEYVYGSYIFPNNIENNPMFKCSTQGLSVEQCMLSRFIYLFTGTTFAVRFVGNDYDTSIINYSDAPTVDYSFYFNNADGNAVYSDIYINERFPVGAEATNIFYQKLTKVFKLADRSDTAYFKNSNIRVSHPRMTEDLVINKGTIFSGVVYIDSANGGSGLGLTDANPCNSLAAAEVTSNFYAKDKNITWVLQGDYSNENVNHASVIIKQPIVFRAVSKTTVFNSPKEKAFYDAVTIRNMTINLNGIDAYHAFRSYSNKPILFKDCIINFANTRQHLLRAAPNSNVTFVNCTFNFLNASGGVAHIQNPVFPNYNVTMINCTIQEGVEFKYATNYFVKGSKETSKRTGDHVLINGKYFNVYDGEKLINPDGSIFSKCVFASDISDIAVSDMTYKICKDLDLDGQTVTLNPNITLDFNNMGKITNGTIVFDRTEIKPYGVNINRFVSATIGSSSTYREGQVVYDASLKKQKLWNGTTWVNLDGTALT